MIIIISINVIINVICSTFSKEGMCQTQWNAIRLQYVLFYTLGLQTCLTINLNMLNLV